MRWLLIAMQRYEESFLWKRHTLDFEGKQLAKHTVSNILVCVKDIYILYIYIYHKLYSSISDKTFIEFLARNRSPPTLEVARRNSNAWPSWNWDFQRSCSVLTTRQLSIGLCRDASRVGSLRSFQKAFKHWHVECKERTLSYMEFFLFFLF